ncbi:MAG: hypothetical protein M3463_15555 [Verrucomicrobiota bacterium]|nr:hypothetical protein [Verrucomicrobiota bacterium]
MFGVSVAISGDTVVVGANGNDDAGASSGSAYVFVRSGATWTQQQKLTASDAASGDFFGISVAISDATILAGASGDDDAGIDSGSVYVFGRSGATWSQQQKLGASDAAPVDEFGRFVAIDADLAVIGAPLDDDGGSSSGSAYVFVRSGGGDTAPDWEITGPLTVDLRAERSGGGRGRIYTITVECQDEAGNAATSTVDVTVPKSQGKK